VSDHLMISHSRRLVMGTAQGIVTAEQLHSTFPRLIREQALSYGKLFDFRGALVNWSPGDVRMHLGTLSAHQSIGLVGPLALILDTTTVIHPQLIHTLAVGARAFALFDVARDALEWLYSLQGIELPGP
jgi:hypothetical protein